MSLLNTAIYYEKTTIHARAWKYNPWIGNSNNKVILLNAVLQDKRVRISAPQFTYARDRRSCLGDENKLTSFPYEVPGRLTKNLNPAI